MTKSSPTPAERAEFNALVVLAQREHRAGRLAEAAEAYRKILALRPAMAEVHNNLGSVLLGQGKPAEAVAHFERATALKPDLFEAHSSLGDIFHEQGKLEQAVARYRQAIALRPDAAETHNNLGAALGNLGDLESAAVHCERALVLEPGLYPAHHNLGNIRRKQGDLEQAVAQYRQALTLKPDYAEAHHNLGNVLKDLGNFEQALASYERAIALKPDYAEAHYHRTDLITFRAGAAELASIEALATDAASMPASKRVYLHFALGKALEDVGQYARAFEQLRLGNALKRRQIDYNEVAYQQYLKSIAKVFDAKLLDRFVAVGDPSPVPIFVLGMPRSGSTLVEQILASHPQIHAAGELQGLDRAVQSLSDPAGRPILFPACVRAINADSLRRLGQQYLKSLPEIPAGKQRITDKMPKNFVYIGLIRLILPGARIIHTMRDPVDTCLSSFSRLFASGLSYSYDLAELGRYYRGYYELMAHWRSVLPPGAMLEVSYEDVVDNLEEQARRLIDYCGLPWDDRCLSFQETSRTITTPSAVQVRQPLYRSSVARWRRYEAYIQPLLAELESCRQPK